MSFFTLMIYLNTVSETAGGKTRFYGHNGKELVIDDEYLPHVGDCMLLDQDKLHDGEELRQSLKYILRTEVLYSMKEGI